MVPLLSTRRAVFIHEPSRTVSERNEEGSCASEGFAKTLETNEMSGWSHTREEECLELAFIPVLKNHRGGGDVNWVHV